MSQTQTGKDIHKRDKKVLETKSGIVEFVFVMLYGPTGGVLAVSVASDE